MRIAVTGAHGFLGWHVRCHAFASGIECLPVDRALLSDPDGLARVLDGVAAVVHCAGVNRGTDDEILDGNVDAAARLAKVTGVRFVYANSIHSRLDSTYGVAKRRTRDLLASEQFSDVVLPNLFGEHGRPHYNSVVATFCHELAAGRTPVVQQDRELPLLHVQQAAELLLQETSATGVRVVEPKADSFTVGEVLEALEGFRATYATGELPDIADPFQLRLFNTYRSHVFPAAYPIPLKAHEDQRGSLVECVRTRAGGQAFMSTTAPGVSRGEHVHLRKLERFVVFAGEAEIALRRLFTRDTVRFTVSGDAPVIVDIPTMWTHSLTNIGDRTLTTFFWTSEAFSLSDPDTFPCRVDDGRDLA